MEQIKKNPNDPDVDQINPEIVKLARYHAMLRMPMELYLNGKLTWMETLELAILMITKEYRAQNRCLIEVLHEKPDVYLMLKEMTSVPKHIPKLKLHDKKSNSEETQQETQQEAPEEKKGSSRLVQEL